MTPLRATVPPLGPLLPRRSTQVMAILNLTTDSFSDGSSAAVNDPARAALEALDAGRASGATILDLGGQSTRPGAPSISADEELGRILPAVRAIRASPLGDGICISIDTYRARVAAEALAAGADLINDVSAGALDPDMLATVASAGASLVLMHMRGTPTTMSGLADYPDGLIPTVAAELLARVRAAEAAGIRRWRMILDPGIGFAKTSAQNLELLRRLPELRAADGLHGLPWLVGASRKAFIGRITGVDHARQRTWGTAAAVTAAVAGGADIVRVHDVPKMTKVVRMADAIWRS